MYAISFVIIDYLIVSASKNKNIDLEPPAAEKLTIVILLFAIIGGRLGYVIFYDLSYFASNIQKIFYLWEGGMSFHGGLIGAVIGSVYFSKNTKPIFESNRHNIFICAHWSFFGRLGNFINSELYGLQTSGSWGVILQKLMSIQDIHP